VKLFTKRCRCEPTDDPEDYAQPPWWERLVYDGGERVRATAMGEVQLSGYPAAS
jgi:multiple sugar transport system permease protein